MQTAAPTTNACAIPLPDHQTRAALQLLGASLLLGLLADLLLRTVPWGLNFPLWIGALTGAAWWLEAGQDPGLQARQWPLLGWAGVFAAGCAWRDSLTLKCLDVGAALLLLALLARQRPDGRLRSGHLSAYLVRLLRASWLTLGGSLLVGVRDISWRHLPRRRSLKSVASVLLGLALALPLMLVFGGLFSAADAAFRNLVVDFFDVNFEWLFLHGLFTALGAWVACGYLRSLRPDERTALPPVTAPGFIKLGSVETNVVLGCLNLLFLTFIGVQLRYFFGGAQQVEVVPGLTYSEYARRGFFELVTVAMLLLPVLLLADWLTRNETRKRGFRVLTAALVGLLFVVMASAVQRMRLYQLEFGLTELRLYTTTFMAWLAVVFAWFLLTVLRGRRERFTFGALVAGLALLAALHVLNPDARIVRTNLQRAQAGKPFDAAYATSLSADAVPILVAALPSLERDQQAYIREQLQTRWPAEAFADWRAASLSRFQASRALLQTNKRTP